MAESVKVGSSYHNVVPVSDAGESAPLRADAPRRLPSLDRAQTLTLVALTITIGLSPFLGTLIESKTTTSELDESTTPAGCNACQIALFHDGNYSCTSISECNPDFHSRH